MFVHKDEILQTVNGRFYRVVAKRCHVYAFDEMMSKEITRFDCSNHEAEDLIGETYYTAPTAIICADFNDKFGIVVYAANDEHGNPTEN